MRKRWKDYLIWVAIDHEPTGLSRRAAIVSGESVNAKGAGVPIFHEVRKL